MKKSVKVRFWGHMIGGDACRWLWVNYDYGIDYNIEKENFANAKKILAICLSVI